MKCIQQKGITINRNKINMTKNKQQDLDNIDNCVYDNNYNNLDNKYFHGAFVVFLHSPTHCLIQS